MKRPREPLISIIVPNYEGREIFPACIASLLAQDYPNFEIVFVDDSSTDGSYDLAKRLYRGERRVKVTRTSENSGFVGACNHALRHCKGEWVIPGNNDVHFPKSWLSEMYSAVRGKERVVGASAFVRGEDDPRLKVFRNAYGTQTLVLTDAWRPLAAVERHGLIEVPVAGCLMLPRKALGRYIFEPDYFAYGEDVNCSWRLRLQGYRIVANARAVGYTENSYTRRKVPSFNRRAIYYGTRNMALNFLVIYELKNVLRLALPFALLQLGALLSNPKAAPLRLKAHLWVLLHPHEVVRRRKAMQRLRRVPDAVAMRLLSCKIFDPKLATTSHARLIARAANACMRAYCRLVLLKAFDRDEPSAAPVVDEGAVRPG